MEQKYLGKLPMNILKSMSSRYYKVDKIKRLILVVPGNPGLVGYYEEFINALQGEIKDDSTAVWALSHSCHTINPETNKHISLSKVVMKEKNPLEQEIEHKLEFLESEIPPNCKINLIGHSIGCYMILAVLQMLIGFKNRPKNMKSKDGNKLFERIDKCCFLFPTIERMRISPNGTRLFWILKYIQPVVVGLITILGYLPTWIKNKILMWHLQCTNTNYVTVTNTLLTPSVFSSMLHLAYNELSEVEDLEVEAINTLKDKLIFYFGNTDGWCPLSYAKDLQKNCPEVECHIDEQGIVHAFVIKSSQEMAEKVHKLFKL